MDPRGGPDAPRGDRVPQPVASAAVVQAGVPHGSLESGWLPDYVFVGDKFESGLAFFSDAQGRITRFSREPADLAAARRLAGQAALPGLVNSHSHVWQRAIRGRTEPRTRGGRESGAEWLAALAQVAARMSDEELFDTARLAFLEMLYAGITCVGEFHFFHHQPDGTPWPEAGRAAREIVRAAHDVGIRIALLNVAWTRGEPAATARFRSADVEAFVREAELLRAAIERDYPADEAWLGAGVHSLAAVPLEQVKAIAAYARAQRFRFHLHLPATAAEAEAGRAEQGRSPLALLAEHGVVDKRFTAVVARELADDELKALAAARAVACVCPSTAGGLGLGVPSADAWLAAGAGIALGTDAHGRIDLLEEARTLEHGLRALRQQRNAFAPDAAAALFHAATVAGARSLGATGGALEVGRPADFFTVNLHDPALAGVDPATLLAQVVFALDRRAIRDVWIGARQRVANGRHVQHGPIVGRFVDAQKRIWGGGL